jgi:hypothetical protein
MRWSHVLVLFLLVGFGAVTWLLMAQRARARAMAQLEAAGFGHYTTGLFRPPFSWRTIHTDWRWYWPPGKADDAILGITFNGSHTKDIHDFGTVGPALRLVDPVQLSIGSCTGLRSLHGLSGLKRLQLLVLYHCKSLEDLGGLGERSALSTVDIDLSPALRNVDGLKTLRSLKKFHIRWCPNLRDINGLGTLASLEDLSIVESHELRNIDALAGLTALTRVEFYSCDKLENVDGLRGNKRLEYVTLSNCRELKSVEGLVGLLGLKGVFLGGCTKVPSEQIAALKGALPSGVVHGP